MLSVLRIIVAALFLEHGTQKVLGFPPSQMPHMPLLSMGGVSGILELVGGALLLLGLFVRPTAFILAGEMAVAYFMVHAPQSFYPIINKGELAVLYCFIFLYFVVAGGGVLSLDQAFKRKQSLTAKQGKESGVR
jgi:putative oxidoreductase